MNEAGSTCGGHAGFPAELRALVLQSLDRVEPVLHRFRDEPPTAATATCASCPLCAVVAALRGERPELAVRLAEQAAGLLAVLRSALEEGAAAAPAATPAGAPESGGFRSERRVQRIPVTRVRAAR